MCVGLLWTAHRVAVVVKNINYVTGFYFDGRKISISSASNLNLFNWQSQDIDAKSFMFNVRRSHVYELNFFIASSLSQ